MSDGDRPFGEKSDDEDVEAHGSMGWDMWLQFSGRDLAQRHPEGDAGEKDAPSGRASAARAPEEPGTDGERG